MFKRRPAAPNDLSTRLRDVRLWNPTPEAIRIEPVNYVCTLCVDPHSRLFAVGTSHGEIRIYDELFRETILITPKGAAVKMLQIARPKDLFKLLCLDNKNVLHVWNLDAYGIPPLQTSYQFNGLVYRIATCISHSHVLLAMQSGDILTFDLSSLRLSTYKIPYALTNHDHQHLTGPAVDVAMLPQKLQHVLIGYEDGIVLYDIVSQKTLQKYVLDSLPGSNDPSILTTLAVHPLGQHFVAGYVDGTICIWNLQTSTKVWVGFAEGLLKSSGVVSDHREPIFKLEWISMEASDGSSTSFLTVLGGQRLSGGSQNYINVLGASTANLRAAKVDAITDMNFSVFAYLVPHPVQDFIIITPSAENDEVSGRIVLLAEDVDHTATLDAFEFPPKFRQSSENKPNVDKVVDLEFAAELEESEGTSRNLAATLDDLRESDEDNPGGIPNVDTVPTRVSLPFQLFIGPTSVLSADILSVKQPEYLRLVRRLDGTALVSKEDRYRLLVTRHRDRSIRFWDVSILADSVSDLSLYPRALEHLTIRVLDIPEIALRPDIHKITCTNVAVASESLECAITLSTGEVVVLGLGLQSRTVETMDDELIDLSDARDNGDVYTPRFILRTKNGGAGAVCLSGIGFLAVAFHHGLLIIVDMRGPNIILRDAQDATSKHGEVNIPRSLFWAISALREDAAYHPRLLALRHDGTLNVHTLTHSNGTWAVDKTRSRREVHHSLSAPCMSIVIDMQDGSSCEADASSLANSMDSTVVATSSEEVTGPHSLWIAANRKEIRCGLDITGEKVAKVNFHDALDHTAFINIHGSSVLVTFSQFQETVYSLPSLEPIYSIKLPISTRTSLSTQCIRGGDLLLCYRSSGSGVTLVFFSLLNHSRPTPSGNVNFRIQKHARSHLSQNVTKVTSTQEASPWGWGSNVASWIKSFAEETSISGDEVDLIFAGRELPAGLRPTVATPSSSSRASTDTSSKSTSGVTNWGQGLYQQLSSAASERGERLGQLEDHFQSLEAGSKDMVTQAKKLAERQAAKRWFL